MSRYREIPPAEMSPAQQRVRDQIIAGKRGRFGGPFELLIRAPEICGLASQLGEHLRWGTSLPDRLSELAIITTARFWRAQYEWYAHAPLAEKAGVPGAAIEAIRTDGAPLFTAKDEALVHRICSEHFPMTKSNAAASQRRCCRTSRHSTPNISTPSSTSRSTAPARGCEHSAHHISTFATHTVA